MSLIKRVVIVVVSLVCSIGQLVVAQNSQGYISNGSPVDDRIALLIEIGKIRAGLDAFHTSASRFTASPSPYKPGLSEVEIAEWQLILASSVNQEIIDAYVAIEPLIKVEQGAEVLPRLIRLASLESRVIATDNKRDNRDAKRIEYETARGTEDRLNIISDDIFPTRKEYFLVASALLRLGGEHMSKAINDEGVVVDLYQLLMAAAYNYIADKSHPRWVSYCKEQSEPLAKLDEGLDNIDVKIGGREKGMQLEATANDFYKLAATAEKIGERLPDNDKAICN